MSRWDTDDELVDELDSDDGWPVDDFQDEVLACPECGAEIDADAEACPACGYWITDADRERAWRAGSASGRIRVIGLWLLAFAAIGYAAALLS
ncbi:MAG: zinc ribbon domain-containing protein [Planctomycetota bacterium]